MLTKERRPFTEAERETVRSLLSATHLGQGCLDRTLGLFMVLGGSFLLGGLLVLLPLLAWDYLAGLLHRWALPHPVNVGLLCAGAVGGMCLAAWLTYQGSRDAAIRLAEERRNLQQELDGGEAEAWHCEAARVVELEEQGDEGPGFFLELGPGQTLFLQGQYLYDFVQDEYETDGGGEGQTRSQDPKVWPPAPRTESAGYQFPCRRFDLIYALHSRSQLGLICLSRRFEDWPTYSPGAESTWEAKCYPEDGNVLPVSLDTLDADLNRWAAQQEPPKD